MGNGDINGSRVSKQKVISAWIKLDIMKKTACHFVFQNTSNDNGSFGGSALSHTDQNIQNEEKDARATGGNRIRKQKKRLQTRNLIEKNSVKLEDLMRYESLKNMMEIRLICHVLQFYDNADLRKLR